MTKTRKPAAPQPQAELSEAQLDAAVAGGSLADGRYTLTVLASQVGTSHLKDGLSNTILFGERC